MEVEYEAEVPDDAHELLASTILKVRNGRPRLEILADLLELQKLLREPIYGTVDVEPEDWNDLD